MTRPRKASLKTEEIPDYLMEGIHDYSIVLFGYRAPTQMPDHCGTGTLVSSRNKYYILTAHHCAARLLKYERMCLAVRPSGVPLVIQRLEPIYIGDMKDKAWGPDLAFLRIHPVDKNKLDAVSHKLFYNLDRHVLNIEKPPQLGEGIWTLVGAPKLLTKVKEPRILEMPLMAYKITVKRSLIRRSFDYIEIGVPLNSPNALKTFQGVSGGGLWHTDFSQDSSGALKRAGRHRLVGCAFYETEVKRKYRYIRCHGWRSIYEHGISKLPRG